jgi:alkanesulfonate monooxygenase SsuD/methylene tetrahydromethanopterin reductase-like flavin-dependent oxidoreductase (luciferase family)
MEIGIGLPNTIPGTEGRTLIEWSVQAEAAGFSSLCTVGRLVYPSYDDLIALAAAAAVTERVRLTTGVLIAPLFTNTALLAKQAASLDRLSGGRMVLGVGLGGRDEDFTASGLSAERRGGTLNRQLEEMKRIWAGEKRGHDGGIGPEPVRAGGPELIIGGYTEAAFRRVARYGDGWMMGAGGDPERFAEVVGEVEEAWRKAGRSGSPRKIKPAYFALGPNARESAERELGRYYSALGDEVVNRIVGTTAIGEEMVRAYVEGFEPYGCDELIFLPCSSDPEQIALLQALI